MLLHFSIQTAKKLQNQHNPLFDAAGLVFLSSQETEFSRPPPIIVLEPSDGSEPLPPRRDLFSSGTSMLPLRLKNTRRL